MSDTNFSLLSQEEIDTLISFLVDKSSSVVESEVLNQDSIDKLIVLMKNINRGIPGNKVAMQSVRAVSSVVEDPRAWTLKFEEDPQTKYICIYATDGSKKEYITPRGFACTCFVDDGGEWGYCVSPIHFVEIAQNYNLKFEKETYEQICKHYADKNYGDVSYDVDDYFLASSKNLLQCLK